MASLRDLVDDRAELDDEEDDESFGGDGSGDEQPRRSKQRPDDLDDSSEEDDDDDDEEEERKIREGFIVDEDEEDGGADSDERERRKRKKRRRAEREQEEVLDEEDLDLIGENNPQFQRAEPTQSKFKRLKRGHTEDDRQRKGNALDEMFSEDEDENDQRAYNRLNHNRAAEDEFDDFIEEDYEDEDERLRKQEDREVARGRDRLNVGSVIDATGLDKETLEDMEQIFGNGEDYGWALVKEDEEDFGGEEQAAPELKDVFEPSQLAEKLLTEDDNEIRATDEPERFQLDRRPFKKSQISPDLKEETKWIANQMWEARKFSMDSGLEGPFSKAVNKVLEFFVVDYVEVPYVFQHRKDYLIQAKKVKNPHYDRRDQGESEYQVTADKLLNQDDLWRILELDIKFRGFIEKRSTVEKLVVTLRGLGIEDQMVEDLIPLAREMDELQDLLDYVNFKYAAQLKKDAEDGPIQEKKRPGARTAIFDRARNSRAYDFYLAYGLKPSQVVANRLSAQSNAQRMVADDPDDYPVELADSLIDGEFSTGSSVMHAARQLYAEELFTSPRLRKAMRTTYFMTCVVDCFRTDKGLRKLEESHPLYEIKYLKSQTLADLAQRPEIFLKMLKAEEEGLVEVKISLRNLSQFKKQFYSDFASDNYSNKADAWNEERQKVLDLALTKLDKMMVKAVKDAMRTQCQESVLKICREEFSRRLDQAPYKPRGMVLGTAARVLAFSNGMSDPAREKISWAWVEEDGRCTESGQLGNLSRDEEAREKFKDLVSRRKPDVIAASGFSSDTNKLVKDLENLVHEQGLMGPQYDDPETNVTRTDHLEVIVVNDEVARLYKDSPRAQSELPTIPPITRYCVALAKYLQDPLKEYAAIGQDIVSLNFHPCQSLLPEDKLKRYLETAMVDLVNLVGVDINDAVSDPYVANLLPYVCGLGPRKAQAVIKGINMNGGSVIRRDELVGDPDNNKLPVVGVKVWDNCASFLFIDYDATNPQTEPLDNTRVHPEDYELGRKMAADALELDEEDVKAETDENGPGAVVRKLFRDDEQDKVNELVLEEYAEQLEQQYSQRKRATLETIRAELQAPYEELRHTFTPLKTDEIFTMFTGETRDTLAEGMIVAVNVRVVKDDFAIVRLDCGIEGRIEAHEVSFRSSVKDVLSVGQIAQAKILELDRKAFLAKLSVREDALRVPYRKRMDHDDRNWDFEQEREDRDALKEKDATTGRTQRVINHPLFKPFNSTQAEEYLGSQAPGEVIIRPSSKGNDHLAITWKVADAVFQHIDVLELQKENEFSVGRLLRVGKFNYTDLDELIVDHVKAMARKVAEMMQHEKFQKGSRSELERWLTTYMDANPNRSSYAFCIDSKHAGYFWLCFKANRNSHVMGWPVRVVPNGYEFLKAQYPDMKALTNGFKIRYQAEISRISSANGR